MNAHVSLDRHGFSAARPSESATRFVGSDRRNVLRAFRNTQGKSDPERSVYWLEELAKAEFRGRGDTMSAARDRVATKFGAPITKTKRLWDRWQTMKTVCGSVMIPLMLAYEDLCEAIEVKADDYARQRLQIQGNTDADMERPSPAGAGVVRAAAREEA